MISNSKRQKSTAIALIAKPDPSGNSMDSVLRAILRMLINRAVINPINPLNSIYGNPINIPIYIANLTSPAPNLVRGIRYTMLNIDPNIIPPYK